MFKKLVQKFSKDIGIDLGTANTLVYERGRGIVINEPSVVAINQKTGKILAVGSQAKKMVGKTPSHISAVKPLTKGVISDFEVTEQMLKYFISQIHKQVLSIMPKPRIVIGIPSQITPVEKKAVYDAGLSAGARSVYLIEEPMAAAIGAKMPVQDAKGSMIIDIGGGTTEIAVISLGGIVKSISLRLAGDKLNQDIIHYMRDEFNIIIGERTAEELKIAIGSVFPLKKILTAKICGRDLTSGLPKETLVNNNHIRMAMYNSIKLMLKNIREVLEETPPELMTDIMQKGIALVGGGGLLRGLDQLVIKHTKAPVLVDQDPLTTVVRGAGMVLENIDELKEVLSTNF
ncbi:rod shape-determining protein [bacterium]|nr:rod shape-determining protein [bacterium]|tara:strand:- start:10129 stop:11163 length:1035 start_codon:yes stop_codon:yes gene_type:complete